jgi:enamine deaminase RidA (YjgF/YER057c/UK114 family)
MEQRRVNPWSWQDRFGFSQAIEVTSGARTLFCAGQTSVDSNGQPVHAKDMRAQLNQAFDNLEAVLRAAGFALGDVVRLNYYTTDVDRLLEGYDALVKRLAAARCQPSSTLLGVDRLAFPELMIEIEATAVK